MTSITYSSAITENGEFHVYFGEGRLTDDAIPDTFFGCAGVAEIPQLQKKMISIGHNGFRHHMVAGKGCHENALREAFGNYLGYRIIEL